MPRVLALSALGICIGACGAATPHRGLLEVARQRSPDVTEQSLSHGQSVFESKCHACHKQPNPKRTRAEEWPRLVENMGKQAHLDPASKKDLLAYVLAVHDSDE